jgi:hypothetical protein
MLGKTAALEQHQHFGDSVLQSRPSNTSQNHVDSELAELWGGSSIGAPRDWQSADSDRQLRVVKSSLQVLQMELADARQQALRSVESENQLRAQLQRVLLENDAALVMLGQVCVLSPFVAAEHYFLCVCWLALLSFCFLLMIFAAGGRA